MPCSKLSLTRYRQTTWLDDIVTTATTATQLQKYESSLDLHALLELLVRLLTAAAASRSVLRLLHLLLHDLIKHQHVVAVLLRLRRDAQIVTDLLPPGHLTRQLLDLWFSLPLIVVVGQTSAWRRVFDIHHLQTDRISLMI